jgi:two-component sensor histidine kinase
MTASSDTSTDHARRDARLAWLSIVGFWSFYFLINTVRTFIMGEPRQVDLLGPRVIVATLSMAITGIAYQFLRRSSAASVRRSIATAAAVALPAAIAYSTLNWFAFEKLSHPPKRLDQTAAHSPALSARPPPGAAAPPETVNVGQPMSEHHESPLTEIEDNAANGYFFFIAWAALFLSLRYAAEVQVLERRSADLRAAAQSAELRALRYQVNPHFLFNTLNSLSSLILTDKRGQAEKMVLNLATFFRTSLTGNPTEDVSLEEEIALQRLYLDIEAVRFPERLSVTIDIPESLRAAQVPGLILQPLVENAVKHGVSRTPEPVTIAITARQRGDELILAVENRAAGAVCEPGRLEGNGVGLPNVRDRLAARFGEAATCRCLVPAPGSFRVELAMPMVRHVG